MKPKSQKVLEVSISKARRLPPAPSGSNSAGLGGRIVDSSRPQTTVVGLPGGGTGRVTKRWHSTRY